MSSSSTASSHPLASIVRHGKTLAGLARRAKAANAHSARGGTRKNANIAEKVELVITELLGVFNREQGASSFAEDSLARLLNQIEESLEEFIKIDPDSKSKYESLAEKLGNLKPRKNQSSASAATSSSPGNTDAAYCQLSAFKYLLEEFEAAFESLTEKEMQCLLCFTLFPAGVEVKKRELIHCWIGMNLIDDPPAAEYMLAKLVLEGLVERVMWNKRMLSRYVMHEGVRSKLLNRSRGALEPDNQYGSWSIMHSLQQQPPESNSQPKTFVRNHTLHIGAPVSDGKAAAPNAAQIQALLNISQTTLNAKRFGSISKMKSLKVLHIGCWRQNPENYIVAEGIDTLKDLKQVRSLSLQGVSGIVKLPDSLYRLYDLKVLDLRACHNFEFINPEGIVFLKQLTHLDLSECYLLDHVPKAITELTQLQVLKGFVINPLPQAGKKVNNLENNGWPCEFSDLSKLTQLVTLTVRTRRLSFPTAHDLGTLSELSSLHTLRIAWVGSSNDCQPYGGVGSLFPKKLHKLELQAAPEGAVSRLLALISTAGDNCLEKLYIRGGGLSDLSTEKHQLPNVKVVRLRYLPELHLDWVKFGKSFPGLRRLEVLNCPNLVFFPCNTSGVWEST